MQVVLVVQQLMLPPPTPTPLLLRQRSSAPSPGTWMHQGTGTLRLGAGATGAMGRMGASSSLGGGAVWMHQARGMQVQRGA